MGDWRLQGQERYLAGVALSCQHYRASRDGWEHDHCEFCGAKFSKEPEDLNEGYVTGDGYHWVCPTCYEDFRDRFHWTLSTGPE